MNELSGSVIGVVGTMPENKWVNEWAKFHLKKKKNKQT